MKVQAYASISKESFSDHQKPCGQVGRALGTTLLLS